uniref:Superoxide dismutase n=1 Tax=Ditylum brightwellii TaxID=49249 RepID=A0A7S4WK62_9STRA|mmetsp:Transcript_25213/g.33562  ORF Transcript_25213/g.33562 Transcript_25213/m.33562 type:complete len:229 (+) Transcript_25213:86-772(+)
MKVLPLGLVTALVASARATTELPPLPYGYKALEPIIGRRTLEIHHDKHHAKYVNTMNLMISGTNLESMSLEDIIKTAAKTKNQALFNNAAQAWNHAFYWKCMSPNGGGSPQGKLAEMIISSFGSVQDFLDQFAEMGNTAFGSGWAWLVYDQKKKTLSVTKTIGADNPMTRDGLIPILTMDVWEHAYYLDYQNLRPSYIEKFLAKLVNWDYVSDNLERAMSTGQCAAEF